MRDKTERESGYMRLKRASAIGFGVVLVWICLSGGYALLQNNTRSGWIAIVLGVLLLAVPFTGFFRQYWNTSVSTPAIPVLILAANAFLIVLYGSIARIYLTDPFIGFNDSNTLTAMIFGAATALSVIALVANIVALAADRRSGGSGQSNDRPGPELTRET